MANDRIRVHVEEDGLEARVSITSGPAATEADLRSALAAAGVVSGVDGDACTRLGSKLAEPAFEIRDARVAAGTAAEVGENGSLELVFEVGIQPGRLREDGSFDLRHRELLRPVAEEDRIAFRRPAGAGQPGLRVDGAEIPALMGQADTTRLGPGVCENESGDITATRSGVILVQQGKLIDVVTHHVHSGDVDLRSGHLETMGSLTVKGCVARGFRVRASGDVQIARDVDGGSVCAVGDVQIGGAVIAGEDGSVAAGGSVALRHAQAARIRCERTLTLSAAAVSSELRAQEIQIGGQILGGRAISELSISVQKAGSPMGAKTLLSTAEPLENRVDSALGALKASKARRMAQRRKQGGLRGRKSAGKSGRQQRAAGRASLKKKQGIQQRRRELLGSARIDVHQIAHPGVVVRFGSHRLQLEQPVRAVRFRFDLEQDTIVQEVLDG